MTFEQRVERAPHGGDRGACLEGKRRKRDACGEVVLGMIGEHAQHGTGHQRKGRGVDLAQPPRNDVGHIFAALHRVTAGGW